MFSTSPPMKMLTLHPNDPRLIPANYNGSATICCWLWGVMLLEHHSKGCGCSHCNEAWPGGQAMKPGLNIPPQWWGHNSWYTYVIPSDHGRFYLRWTMLSFLRVFQARRRGTR